MTVISVVYVYLQGKCISSMQRKTDIRYVVGKYLNEKPRCEHMQHYSFS